ncbi:retropepsin-like aspartic protease [Clostridium sp. JN-9]|uniref:retropepsin-like aspartic protease n=1 Tax=Clostridium sp. JN-9 TaxID=2507159 RepID=UPI000FFE0DA7|nr:retropepsin-like aspartic protease [Clostridium sp. JN-9]QAT40586.1 hypothetical protein EQM05_10115 [Clostridium sp. JN-9]
MEKLSVKHGLLCTSIEIVHEGKRIKIYDVIVDTGAFHTILPPDIIDEMEISFADDDELIQSYGLGGGICSSVRKRIDEFSCGDMTIKDMKIDFGEIDPEERINGLLGLDFLQQAGIIIDLKKLVMYRK